ncbi:hypothetical protein NDU88_002269 [Pleurodeles waltl]|uniref:Uncharacterized protein n=1 Tax=Pleurodeles waltl TaxID=8319 RepID=A0AAV7VE16_PLEWA|nr:hypothetical protein NDU88_002269 [Pleurodeles waltl]
MGGEHNASREEKTGRGGNASQAATRREGFASEPEEDTGPAAASQRTRGKEQSQGEHQDLEIGAEMSKGSCT